MRQKHAKEVSFLELCAALCESDFVVVVGHDFAAVELTAEPNYAV